jgi:hypothetical protein
MQWIIKSIIFTICLWLVIKISEDNSGRRKIRIHNSFLYTFIRIWHTDGEISLLGLVCAIGTQMAAIVFLILLLVSPYSREFLGVCWTMSLLEVLALGSIVGVIDVARECKSVLSKAVMILISIFGFVMAIYLISPLIQLIF